MLRNNLHVIRFTVYMREVDDRFHSFVLRLVDRYLASRGYERVVAARTAADLPVIFEDVSMNGWGMSYDDYLVWPDGVEWA